MPYLFAFKPAVFQPLFFKRLGIVAITPIYAAGTRLTLFSKDKPKRFFTVIKSWIDQTLEASLRLAPGVPCCHVQDEEGRIHLLLHLPIEEADENRWCLWRPDHAGFDFSVLSHK